MLRHSLAVALGCALSAALVFGGCAQAVPSAAPPAAAGTPAPPRQPASGAASSQPVYEYETQELYARRGENQIYGILYVPQGAGEQMPAVIYSHGYGGDHSYGEQYAQALAMRGYVVYCFDFCGGSPGSLSDGSTLEMSLFTEQADLEAVMAMVTDLPFVDAGNLFLLGTSQGGAVSAITAAAHPDQVRGMALLYPAFSLVEDANRRYQSAGEIPDSQYFLWMTVGRAYFEPLLGYDIYDAIAAYDRDVLILHGDADGIVPLSSSERAVQAYPSAELVTLPGAGHGFSGGDASAAIDAITEYCNAHIQ